jgi:ABC-type nitrate/sulfonate/bicarbonate transport system substrate-binding protein
MTSPSLRRRATIIATSALVALTALTGCKGASGTTGDAAAAAAQVANGEPEKLELQYQGSAGQVTLPELGEDLGYLAPVKLKWVGNTTSGPQDIQSAATGQVDFGGAFNGAIIKLETAGSPIQAVISYYGSEDKTFQGFYALEDSGIHSARDFIGKKVAMNTLGAHYEAVLDTWLRKNGLTDAELKQVERIVVAPINTDEALRQHQIDIAGVGGVIQDKAVARGGLRRIFTDTDVFGPFDAGSYVLRRDFIKQNPNTAKKFVEAVAKALEWERTTPPDQVKAKFTEIINKRGRNEDASLVQFWKSSSITAKGGVTNDENFSRWEEQLVANGDIQKGQVKWSDVYSNALNPYATDADKGKKS